MKNNKGVTLVELLIVIVVMGIIAAFAVPRVGTIITNTQKDAVLADALAIENAATLYCSQTTCDDAVVLTWAQLEPYVGNIDAADWVTDGTVDLAERTSLTSGWAVILEWDGSNTGDSDWEFVGGLVPSASDRANVTDDDN